MSQLKFSSEVSTATATTAPAILPEILWRHASRRSLMEFPTYALRGSSGVKSVVNWEAFARKVCQYAANIQ
ncbi:hypothetical protein [Streptomyces sp. PTD5-9]|uniref:hypothetical protein n=1 Tax=Streptomyces sp. PTD5-9 TaxID=3120150 RepID=UPI003008D94A